MKRRSRFLTNLAGLLASAGVSAWMRTLDYKVAYYDPTVDPVKPDWRGRAIYIFWHEYILFPLYLRGHCNLAMLLSRHRDADLLVRVAMHMGFDHVRGSTARRGEAAIRGLLAKGQSMNLTITPDGPRGPRRVMAPGAVYLASKLGLPLVLMGYGYNRPWRLRSWDKFAVPRPCSRARAVISPPIDIPPDLSREDVEYFRDRADKLLDRLTLEAEAWAELGTRKACQQPFYKAALRRAA